jgi:hypothetical protein
MSEMPFTAATPQQRRSQSVYVKAAASDHLGHGSRRSKDKRALDCYDDDHKIA